MSSIAASSASVPSALKDFVQQQLQQYTYITHTGPLQLTPLSGDAGFRRYFRVNTQPALLAVSAPIKSGLSESAAYFAQMSSALLQQGIPTPQIIGLDAEQNFLLIEDLGGIALLDELKNEGSADLLYGEALMVLTRLQQITQTSISAPTYDASLLEQEMALFKEWFIEGLLKHSLSTQQIDIINTTIAFLTEQALAQTQVLVHRDFHSRNLIYREGEAPGVIDFQDAVWGPITYDLASLLRDCYIRWPQEKVQQWAIGYGNLAIELGLMPAISTEQWLQQFDLMGLQRHIKVLGIFARLSLRDNKTIYLDDLPLVLRYALEVANQYPETQAFAALIEKDLLPSIERQTWYKDYKSAGE